MLSPLSSSKFKLNLRLELSLKFIGRLSHDFESNSDNFEVQCQLAVVG